MISGDDSLTVPMAALGGDGIISVAANAFTGKFCRMAHEALDGRFGEASALHMQMIEAIDGGKSGRNQVRPFLHGPDS